MVLLCILLIPTLHFVVSRLYLEIGQGGAIYTTEIGKSTNRGLYSPPIPQPPPSWLLNIYQYLCAKRERTWPGQEACARAKPAAGLQRAYYGAMPPLKKS